MRFPGIAMLRTKRNVPHNQLSRKATILLQARIKNVGIKPKTDKNFTSTYKKCQNQAKNRQFFYSGVKEITRTRRQIHL